VPLVSFVSAREPASIHMPTVDVCAHGECSVATCIAAGQHRAWRMRDGANWPRGDDAHGQSVLQRRGLSLADGRGSREASSEGTGGRQTSTASQALRQVQS